ncbi:hypothetical protein D3C71_2123890 [compost metagenome]
MQIVQSIDDKLRLYLKYILPQLGGQFSGIGYTLVNIIDCPHHGNTDPGRETAGVYNLNPSFGKLAACNNRILICR